MHLEISPLKEFMKKIQKNYKRNLSAPSQNNVLNI